MSILSRIFGSNKTQQLDDNPPIYGGDGLSSESPAIVNCASMSMAQHLIDNFISERCDAGWESTIEFTISSPSEPDKSLKVIGVKNTDASETSFFFDLTRPVFVAMKMAGL